MTAFVVISIIALVVSIAALVYAVHCSVVYHRFNVGIKDWSERIDSSTHEAIYRAARNILREMDDKISQSNEKEILNNTYHEQDRN